VEEIDENYGLKIAKWLFGDNTTEEQIKALQDRYVEGILLNTKLNKEVIINTNYNTHNTHQYQQKQQNNTKNNIFYEKEGGVMAHHQPKINVVKDVDGLWSGECESWSDSECDDEKYFNGIMRSKPFFVVDECTCFKRECECRGLGAGNAYIKQHTQQHKQYHQNTHQQRKSQHYKQNKQTNQPNKPTNGGETKMNKKTHTTWVKKKDEEIQKQKLGDVTVEKLDRIQGPVCPTENILLDDKEKGLLDTNDNENNMVNVREKDKENDLVNELGNDKDKENENDLVNEKDNFENKTVDKIDKCKVKDLEIEWRGVRWCSVVIRVTRKPPPQPTPITIPLIDVSENEEVRETHTQTTSTTTETQINTNTQTQLDLKGNEYRDVKNNKNRTDTSTTDTDTDTDTSTTDTDMDTLTNLEMNLLKETHTATTSTPKTKTTNIPKPTPTLRTIRRIEKIIDWWFGVKKKLWWRYGGNGGVEPRMQNVACKLWWKYGGNGSMGIMVRNGKMWKWNACGSVPWWRQWQRQQQLQYL